MSDLDLAFACPELSPGTLNRNQGAICTNTQSSMTCASTNLAMRIEIALEPATSPKKQLAARTQIFAELEYLRESCEYWNSLIWTLRMFEAVIARTKLGMAPVGRFGLRDVVATSESANSSPSNDGNRPAAAAAAEKSNGRPDIYATFDNFAVDPMTGISALPDDVFGLLPIGDSYDWLQDSFVRSGDDLNGGYGYAGTLHG